MRALAPKAYRWRAGALLGVAALLLGLGSCAAPSYYFQAVGGQVELWRLAQPIDEVIESPATQPFLKARLAHLKEIREFASRELGLPDNGSYRSYAELKRPFVVWNVFAAEEFSVTPKLWCFMLVGCVGYRGYFSREGAEAYAAELAAEGYDVYVGGVPAYSTLGWFDDPVLSTFVHYPESELARLIFHELAHQVAYVRDDSTFNESFAVAVESAGVERWLARRNDPAEREAYEARQARRRGYLNLIERYRVRLGTLYRSAASPEDKRAGKARLFAEMQQDYQGLKTSWGGYSGYDRIFSQRLNNAFIASASIYTQLVPAFRALLAEQGGDLPRFYAAVKALARQPKAERDARLAALSAKAGVASR